MHVHSVDLGLTNHFDFNMSFHLKQNPSAPSPLAGQLQPQEGMPGAPMPGAPMPGAPMPGGFYPVSRFLMFFSAVKIFVLDVGTSQYN